MHRGSSSYGQPPPTAFSSYGQPLPRAPSPYGQPSSRAPSPYSQKPPFPYGEAPPRSQSPQPPSQRTYTPQPPIQPYSSQQVQPPASGDIVPGSVIYTTSAGPDGRVIYHPFKAMAASYQTANGVVSGIQWVPVEATHILPQDAQPASKDFTWNRGNKDKDKLTEWQHEEDKKRKREEKEATKRLRQQQEYRNEEKAKEYERTRRMSFNVASPPVDFPPQNATQSAGYSGSPYQHHVEPAASVYGPLHGRERKHSNFGDYDSLNRQLGDIDLNRESKVNGPEHGRSSLYGPPGSAMPYGASYFTGYASSGHKYSPNPSGTAELPFIPPGSKYSPNPGRAAELPQFMPSSGNSSYPGSAFSSTARGHDVIAVSTNPYDVSSSSQQQVYPRGYVMEGQPMRSRASSPVPPIQGRPASACSRPYHDQAGTFGPHSPRPPPSPQMGGASPHFPASTLSAAGQQILPRFSRSINPNMSYSEFPTTKIQTMEEFLQVPQLPRLPSILKSHDVSSEDWLHLMNDLRLAWSGNTPVADNHGGKPLRRTAMVANLLDAWNDLFFLPRGSEVTLYKGSERRSGPRVGTIDKDLPEDDDSDKSESEDDESDDEKGLEEYLMMRKAATYGPQSGIDPVVIARRRREAKEEGKKARREARRKARAKEKEKIYALYVTHVPLSGAVIPGGYPSVATPDHAPVIPSGYGRHHGGY